ncbi:MAG: ribonuclease Z [Rhodothermales bacterium]|jgi:ribonuclease Z
MSIHHKILGERGRDNALFVRIDSGQRIWRLLFDCGEYCVSTLLRGETQAIDHVFFSHYHMDHVAGFDSFFRCTFDRTVKPNHIWGPPESGRIMHHRFRGYLWNLQEGHPAVWQVHDIHEDRTESIRFKLGDAFTTPETCSEPREGCILDTPDFSIDTLSLEHHGECIAYLVREKPRRNICGERLAELGLAPGPWMQQLKAEAGPEAIEIAGEAYNLAELRRELIMETPGSSIAYVTDFLLDDDAMSRLSVWLRDCDVLVCEAQYRHADLALALRNCHATATLVGQLAAAANVGQLVLFHLSPRYTPPEWDELLAECQAVFPNTRFAW